MRRRAALFFVVSGAHGVGKTTVLEACGALFDCRGIAVRRFHHIVDGVPNKAGHGRTDDRPRLWWRRLVPAPVKMLITATLNELRYVRGINRILAGAAAEARIALSDRYAYDRLVDLRLRRRPLIQRAAVRVVCALLRHPTLTIMLTDDPAAVYQRKQELTQDQIERYQDDLADLCQRLGAPFVVVPVDGRGPNAVAAQIVTEILDCARGHGLTARPKPRMHR